MNVSGRVEKERQDEKSEEINVRRNNRKEMARRNGRRKGGKEISEMAGRKSMYKK